MIGTKLGHYEITLHLGSGGMGDVYQATDSKLRRSVAIKLLPEAFSCDSDRLARFEREAHLLASLNHPNIAAIFGLERTGGRDFLVMELVPGETLAERIQGDPIPMGEALEIARQIAEALEAAHESGVIHRDLKPANVKITPEGRVKVLDFGLGKALENEAATSNRSNSPTMVSGGSLPGILLGTAAFMSPEQARGKAVDKRADIWAFGVVLVELLTRQQLFKGEEISDVLAAVLRQDIDWGALPAATPPRLRRLLERCLDRDVRQRLRDIGEARVEIAKIEAGPLDSLGGSPTLAISPKTIPRSRRVLPWVLLGGAGTALVAMIAAWAPWRPAPAPPTPVRLLARIGSEITLVDQSAALPIALSPDGSTLAFVARMDRAADNRPQLFVRRLDQLQANPLAGTDGARNPFFSPDGRWLAFFTSDKLKKVSVTGGTVMTLCDVPGQRGGTWTDDDTIFFSPGTGTEGLFRVPASGGPVSALGTLSSGMLTQRWPHALPGAAGILYTEHRDITDFDEANLVVAPAAGGAAKIVVRGGSQGLYLASGHLIYLHQGKLVAVRFDLKRLEAVGPPVPVLDSVVADSMTGLAKVAVSSNGTVAYVPGGAQNQQKPIEWMTRDGKTSALRATTADWENPNFSPDGQKLAMDISDGKQRDVFVYEWANDRLTQLTFDSSNESAPVWSHDGKRITFASDRASPGIDNLYSVKADGTGGLERLTDSPSDQRPGSWDPTGKFLVFEETSRTGSSSVMVLSMTGDPASVLKPGPTTTFLDVGAFRRGLTPEFSADGHWVAYRGEGGVYVRPFPGPGGQWKISINDLPGSGSFPRWARTGNQLLFLTGSQVFVAPYVVAGDEFRAGLPELWSPTAYRLFGLKGAPYAVHPDGKRLAIVAAGRQITEVPTNELVFILNFLDEIRRVIPPTKR